MVIQHVQLVSFRNHRQLNIDTGAKVVLLLGPNGSGKTSVLEAISLMSLGRGLRARTMDEITTHSSIDDERGRHDYLYPKSWSLALALADDDILTVECEKGKKSGRSGKKVCRLNENILNSSEMIEQMRVLWLTPQMNTIFIGAAASRRKWLDRMVYAYFPDHALDTIRYNHYIKSRLAVLKSHYVDHRLLTLIEEQLAPIALRIEMRRGEILSMIRDKMVMLADEELGKKEGEFFRSLKLSMQSQVLSVIASKFKDQYDLSSPAAGYHTSAERVRENNSENCITNESMESKAIPNPRLSEKELLVLAAFLKAREGDKNRGYSSFGPHRTDLIVRDGKGVLSGLCSTGEQKVILLAISVAHASMISEKYKNTVLLLDDLVAHLDPERQEALLKTLLRLRLQLFVTTTEDDCKELMLRLGHDLTVVELAANPL